MNPGAVPCQRFYSEPLVFTMRPLPLSVFFSFSVHEKEKKQEKKSPLHFLCRPARDPFAKPAEPASLAALLRQHPVLYAQAILRVPRQENKADSLVETGKVRYGIKR